MAKLDAYWRKRAAVAARIVVGTEHPDRVFPFQSHVTVPSNVQNSEKINSTGGLKSEIRLPLVSLPQAGYT